MVVSAFAASESDDLNLIVDTGTHAYNLHLWKYKSSCNEIGVALIRQSLLFGLAKARLKLSQSDH